MKYRRGRINWATISSIWTLLICLLVQAFLYIKGWDAPTTILWGILGIFLGVQMIWDYMGGYVIPEKYGQNLLKNPNQWLGRYGRAMGIYLLYYGLNGYMFMLIGQTLGIWGSVSWAAVQMLLLMGFRQYIARGMHPFKVRYENNRGRLVFYMDTDDRGFTGGISGIPGQESIIFPEYWSKKFKSEEADALLSMRHGALNIGGHGKGFFLLWVIHSALIALSTWLSPEPVGTFEWLIGIISLYTILMAIASLGLIPMLNRKGILQMDRWLYYKKVDAGIIRKAIEESRRLQNDLSSSSQESKGIPKLIQVTPTLQNRMDALSVQKDLKGNYYIFPDWVFLSWAGMSLINRSFQGSLGMPARWIFYPGE